MASKTFVLTIGYIVATGLLMHLNTAWLGLGDKLFGDGYGGEELYWPLWTVGYAPAAIAALFALHNSHASGARATALACVFLGLILAAMEVSFVLDIFLTAVAQWFILGLIFFALSRLQNLRRLLHALNNARPDEPL